MKANQTSPCFPSISLGFVKGYKFHPWLAFPCALVISCLWIEDEDTPHNYILTRTNLQGSNPWNLAHNLEWFHKDSYKIFPTKYIVVPLSYKLRWAPLPRDGHYLLATLALGVYVIPKYLNKSFSTKFIVVSLEFIYKFPWHHGFEPTILVELGLVSLRQVGLGEVTWNEGTWGCIT